MASVSWVGVTFMDSTAASSAVLAGEILGGEASNARHDCQREGFFGGSIASHWHQVVEPVGLWVARLQCSTQSPAKPQAFEAKSRRGPVRDLQRSRRRQQAGVDWFCVGTSERQALDYASAIPEESAEQMKSPYFMPS